MKEQKRHIGIIPPHPRRHARFLEEFKKAAEASWAIVPRTRFYRISYARLREVMSRGSSYDVVVACRTSDEEGAEENNILNAVLEARLKFRLRTVFIISYNELLMTMRGLDPAREKARLKELVEYASDPSREHLGGIIRTTSTEPSFLISIIADVLEGPEAYLKRKHVYPVENQSHFLNHPPGDTMLGMSW